MNLQKNGKKTTRSFSRLGKLVITILLITCLISITNSCFKSKEVFIAYEKTPGYVQLLPNGNHEVKEAFILRYWEVLMRANIYKIKYETLLKKMEEE